MNEDLLNLEVTRDQQKMLLQGLRFMRSSVLLEMRDSSPKADADRNENLQKIAKLEEQLNGARPAPATADV